MKKFNYDLKKAIEAQPGTTVSPGSEVRPPSQLDVLLHNHKNYERFRHNTLNGISYPLEDIDDETRIGQNNELLAHGNHKSALEEEAIPHVNKAVKTDVLRGFSIILTPECAARIKGAEFYPMSLQHQMTINEKGEAIPKKRVTHDLSYNKERGLSINQRIIEEELPEVIFGWTLSRVLHEIHALRYRYPNKRILMSKVDIEKAYRRLHTSSEMAAKCIALWHLSESEHDSSSNKEIATILSRLPFGSNPAPAEFSICSDITFDLASDLMNCKLWDPDSLPCPLRDEIPPPVRLPDNIPFGAAFEAAVQLPESFKGGTDGYIDDGLNVVLDSEDNQPMVKRAEQCLPMALHLQFRPNAGNNEPIPRGEMASIPKLKAEAFLTETIIFLGWQINSRAFTIALPFDKFKAWSDQITEIIAMAKVPYSEISKLIGRLNHVAYIIPAARHFMGRLRRLEWKASKHRYAKITEEAKKDLLLWLKFLSKANEGISINNIIYRSVTSTSLSDASEFGISGYGFNTGIAWRYELTTEEQVSFDINQKEYLASAINQYIQLGYDESPFPCTNDISDNTSSTAWMYKSNFDPQSHPIHNEIARWTATNLMNHNASSYSQHLPGAMNDIADSLSRDFHLTNEQLIALYNHTRPPYYPQKQMRIIELPGKITSWIASLAQLRHKKRELSWERTTSTLAHGIIGWSGSNTSEPMTPIFKDSHVPKEYDSYVHSHMQYEEEISLPTGIKLRGRPRKRPLTTWLRPSSQVVGRTPD